MKNALVFFLALAAANVSIAMPLDEFGVMIDGKGEDGFSVRAVSLSSNGQISMLKEFECENFFSYDDFFRQAKVFNCDGTEFYFKSHGDTFILNEELDHVTTSSLR